MIVRCQRCSFYFDDEFRWAYCPHGTFPANDGRNHFAHHPESYLDPHPPHVARAAQKGDEPR
jgi:hypothetical protein